MSKDITEPPHYDMKISPIDFILANDLGFIQGNLVKYAVRVGRKGDLDDAISDCRKIQAYAEKLIITFEQEKKNGG